MERLVWLSAQDENALLFRNSKLARDYHSVYLRAFINILDFSSLNKSSILTTLICRESNICMNAFKYLSTVRKNASLYYKDETSRDVRSWWGSSPKQYLLDFLPFDACFTKSNPKSQSFSTFRDHEICTTSCYEDLESSKTVGFILKAKGLKRSLASKLIDNTDFERSAERFCPRVLNVSYNTVSEERIGESFWWGRIKELLPFSMQNNILHANFLLFKTILDTHCI